MSYADFITLLFAFFVVMYAISMQDMAKLKAAAQSIRDAFGKGGDSGIVGMDTSGAGETMNQFSDPSSRAGRVMDMPAGKINTAAEPDPELQAVKEKLEETVSLELGVTNLPDKMQMVFDSRGLVVRLAVTDFFDQYGTEVVPDLRPLLDRVGRVLAGTPKLFRIEGHADPSEKNPPGFTSAWELSAARAAWVARYWINRFEIDPKRVGVAGYSYYRPIRQGGSAWSEGANRRIEIIILNETYRDASPPRSGH